MDIIIGFVQCFFSVRLSLSKPQARGGSMNACASRNLLLPGVSETTLQADGHDDRDTVHWLQISSYNYLDFFKLILQRVEASKYQKIASKYENIGCIDADFCE